MDLQFATASPGALCTVIEDVTGLEFDSEKREEVAAAAVLLNKLMQHADLAHELAQSLARHSRPGADPASIVQRYRNVRLRTTEAQATDHDPFEDDFPSSPTSESGFARDWPRAPQRYAPEEGDAAEPLYSVDRTYLSVSPETLGFRAEPTSLASSSDVQSKWESLLHDTELKLGSDRVYWFKQRFAKKVTSSTCQAANNYFIFTLNAGRHRLHAHFIFDPNNLYVLVVDRRGKISRFEVPVDDTDALARNLVTAFEGYADLAGHALNALAKAFRH